jgi:hypothetical protein
MEDPRTHDAFRAAKLISCGLLGDQQFPQLLRELRRSLKMTRLRHPDLTHTKENQVG